MISLSGSLVLEVLYILLVEYGVSETSLPSSKILIRLPFCNVMNLSMSRDSNMIFFICCIVGITAPVGRVSVYMHAIAAINDCSLLFSTPSLTIQGVSFLIFVFLLLIWHRVLSVFKNNCMLIGRNPIRSGSNGNFSGPLTYSSNLSWPIFDFFFFLCSTSNISFLEGSALSTRHFSRIFICEGASQLLKQHGTHNLSGCLFWFIKPG